MTRQAITRRYEGYIGDYAGQEEYAGWFDPTKATAIEEDTRWNGQNRISCATGSQWEHETLYRTAGDKWVLCHRSQWQGGGESYALIDDEEAAWWLVRNNAEHPAALAAIAAQEVR